MKSDSLSSTGSSPFQAPQVNAEHGASTDGRVTPEPGRRTPLVDRWVDIHVDRGHVSTQVDTLLACGYGRGAFTSGLPRPPQHDGRYQMRLDAHGEVLRTTLNTLRTGVTGYAETFPNRADYEEYVRQLDFLLWDGMETVRSVDAIESGLETMERWVQRFDELDDAMEQVLPTSRFDTEIRDAIMQHKPGEACQVTAPRPRYSEPEQIQQHTRTYLGLLGVSDCTFTQGPELVRCCFEVPHIDSPLTPSFAQLRQRLDRCWRARPALHLWTMHGDADGRRFSGESFSQNAKSMSAAYVGAQFGERVSCTVGSNGEVAYDFVSGHLLPTWGEPAFAIARRYLELIGATDIAVDAENCTFTMPKA